MSGSNNAPTEIDFAIYPASTNRAPGVFAEIDNSQANTGQFNPRALIVAQMVAGPGTTAPGVAFLTSGLTQVQQLCGIGSMAASMFARYRKIDVFGEVWILPLADDAASVASVSTMVLAGAATAGGVFPLYVAGVYVPVPVNPGDSAGVVAVATILAVNAVTTLPVVANGGSNGMTVLFTSRNKGLIANDIDIRVAYQGVAGGEIIPPGLTFTWTPTTSGAQNPTLIAAALSALGGQAFDFIAFPYTDTASLNALQAFLNDQAGRWSPFQELFGGGFGAYRGTFAQRGTFGVTRNDQHHSIMGFYDSPNTVWDWTADYTAACAVSLRNDPNQPLQTLAMNVLPPPPASRDLTTLGARNTMLYDGISTFQVDPLSTVRIDNAITTYQTDVAGAPDDSYLEVERMFGLTFLIRDMRTFLQQQFPRKKLFVDGTRIAPGSNGVTSQTVLASAVARYRFQCRQGNAQDPDGFAAAALALNAGRGLVRLLLPFRLPNQLRQIAMLIQFTAP